jgi:transposase
MLRQPTPRCCLGCCLIRPRCCLVWRRSSGSSASRRTASSAVKVVVEQIAREGPCPVCGVLSSAIKDRPLRRLRDLPACGQAVELWWRKRRLLCAEVLCPRRSFTQTTEAVRPRGRVTERLRDKLATAIATSNRSVTDVAAEYGVSWPTAHRALVTAAARRLPEPEPTAVLGIDETDSGPCGGSSTVSAGSGRIRG